MAYTVEIDQSGKIEATHEDTILALARNVGDTYAILIPATLKRYLIKILQKKYAKPQILYLRLFCASVFLLLQSYGLKKFSTVIIDTEYWGHEAEIKGELLNFIRQHAPLFSKDDIVMSVTWLHMHHHNHGLDDVSLVIMAHTLLIAGSLLAPVSLMTAWLALALFLVGLGWNLCYIAGSSLLADALAPAERSRVQGANELVINLSSAVSSLGSGIILAYAVKWFQITCHTTRYRNQFS